MQPTEAVCWACKADATHCLTLNERPPRIPPFVVSLCQDCREMVVGLLFSVRRRTEADIAE